LNIRAPLFVFPHPPASAVGNPVGHRANNPAGSDIISILPSNVDSFCCRTAAPCIVKNPKKDLLQLFYTAEIKNTNIVEIAKKCDYNAGRP
jgi:hypothetical protein